MRVGVEKLRNPVEQIIRQLLPSCLAGAGLRLTHLADAYSQAGATHDSLQRSRANLYAVPLMHDRSHAASAPIVKKLEL